MQVKWKKNTMIFLACQMISLFGSALVQYAITWHITLTTQSGAYMTLAIVCGFAPTFLLSPFAGVWADRYDRKKLIILADGAIALTTLILAISIMLGNNAIWPLFVALGMRALGSAVQTPCISAILPSIVPEEHLTRVNGINGSAQSLITLASPMISAVLLKTAPYFSIFFIDVVTAAIAIIMLLTVFKLPSHREKKPLEAPDYLGEMRSGFSYVGRTKYLKNFFIYLATMNLLFAPAAFLTPLQVTRNFGENEYYLMAIEMAFAVGMILGGVTIAAWGGFKNRIHSIGFAVIAMAVCTSILGLSIPFWMYLIVMGLFGLAMPLCNTPAIVMLQERVDPDYMGRVFGVMTMISSSVMPIGMLVFGPLADIVPIERLLLGTGIVMLLLALLFLRDKPLLQAGLAKAQKAQLE